MKTISTSVEYLYGENLVKETNKILSDIKHYVKQQNESVTDKNLKLQVKPEFWDLRVDSSMFVNLSKTKQKELNKILYQLEKRWTVRNMNRFLHFIGKYITETPFLKIEKCKKEQDIQMKRKAWLKARNEADAALAAYKEEKGNYYK